MSQRQIPADNSPVTTTDRVHVRGGTSVTVPVLDNDIAPSGDRLSLVSDAAAGCARASSRSTSPVDVKGDVGTAFVSGRNVRYIAPDLKERDSFEVRYIARSSTGDDLDGATDRHRHARPRTPTPRPSRPRSRPASSRAAASRSGCPAAASTRTATRSRSRASPRRPRLGRVLSFGGNFLEYQGYPRTTGTDEFEYSVDRQPWRRRHRHGAGGRGAPRRAAAPVGRGRPAHRRARPDRGLRPDGQRLHRARRRGRDQPARRPRRGHARPGDQPGLGAGSGHHAGRVAAGRLRDHQRHQHLHLHHEGGHRPTSSRTRRSSTTPSVRPTTAGACRSTSSRAPTTPTGRSRDLTVVEVYGTRGRPDDQRRRAQIKVNRGPNPIVVPVPGRGRRRRGGHRLALRAADRDRDPLRQARCPDRAQRGRVGQGQAQGLHRQPVRRTRSG